MSNPDFSVIVPAHNESGFIDRCLRTIQRQLLEPADLHGEAIVVDNGSSDETASIARQYPVKVVSLPGKAFPSIARNTGVEHARGRLLVFIDADVLITDEWVAALRRQLQTADDEFLTGATYDVSLSKGWIECCWFALDRRPLPRYLNGGNIITTRRVFDRVGGFDRSLETAEDVDFCRRVAAAGVEVEQDLSWRAHHQGNPQSLGAFIRRERWHGRGDLVSIASALRSPIVWLAVSFIVAHLAILVGAALWLANVAHGATLFLTGLGAVVALVEIRRARHLGWPSLAQYLPSMIVSYAYLVGRSLCILDRLRPGLPAGR